MCVCVCCTGSRHSTGCLYCRYGTVLGCDQHTCGGVACWWVVYPLRHRHCLHSVERTYIVCMCECEFVSV